MAGSAWHIQSNCISITTVAMEEPQRISSFMEEEWFKILAQIISNVLLFFLVFGMSATVKISHLREQLNNKFAIFTGKW
jgi:predicted Na+-dependent transporter